MVRRLICSTSPPVPLTIATSPTRTWSSTIRKKPGDDVADQRLRAEADREADDAGAGQDRRDVDVELAQDDQDGGRPDQHGERAAHDAGDRLRALAPLERVEPGADRHLALRAHDDRSTGSGPPRTPAAACAAMRTPVSAAHRPRSRGCSPTCKITPARSRAGNAKTANATKKVINRSTRSVPRARGSVMCRVAATAVSSRRARRPTGERRRGGEGRRQRERQRDLEEVRRGAREAVGVPAGWLRVCTASGLSAGASGRCP